VGFVDMKNNLTNGENPMKTLKIFLMSVIVGITLVAMNACRGTMHGAGEDIENAGDAVQDAVN
jgi:predicted small secreted protein